MIFGKSKKSLDQLNEMLLQTGKMDTSDESRINVAVVYINISELVLNEISKIQVNDTTIEKYSGHGFSLTFIYSIEDKNSEHYIYNAKAIISNSNIKSVYQLIGEDNFDYL
jgi:hypothetical protein